MDINEQSDDEPSMVSNECRVEFFPAFEQPSFEEKLACNVPTPKSSKMAQSLATANIFS